MARQAYHWNRDIVCAVDTETTGLIPEFSEVVQIAIVALTSRYEVNKEVQPLNLFIRPENPERINLMEVPWGKAFFDKVMKYGIDSIAAMDAVEAWYDKHLNPPYNKYGSVRGKIIPLGHNYGFDERHLRHFLTNEIYEDLFSGHCRDSMHRALHLNDQAAYRGESVPFSKVSLNWLCSQLEVKLDNAHDALCDSIAAAECYRRMLRMGV